MYLGFAGSVEYPGLIVARQTFDTSQTDTFVRISAAKLIGLVLGKAGTIQSANAISPDWERLEMVVCAAFMTACNSGPLDGSSLEEFLTRFLSELISVDKEGYVELRIVDSIKWTGSLKAQFMWPYNAKLPTAISQLLNFVGSTCPPNSQQFDAGTFVACPDSDAVALQCLVEVKSSTSLKCLRSDVRDALKRQDSVAKVSFIVVDISIKSWKNFHIDDYRVLHRGMREEETKKFAEGENLKKARLFKVEIDDERKVKLIGLDGKNSQTASETDRLIFLISRADISDQCQPKDLNTPQKSTSSKRRKSKK